jgi:hypothetical protein
VLVAETEGGWWFLCENCDHVWDQRQQMCINPVRTAPEGAAARPQRAPRRLWRVPLPLRAALSRLMM